MRSRHGNATALTAAEQARTLGADHTCQVVRHDYTLPRSLTLEALEAWLFSWGIF
jgi:hypothetical protein